MLTAQLTEIRRDLAQFPSAALQRACTAVDDARTLPWPRQLQLRRRLMLACGTKCWRLSGVKKRAPFCSSGVPALAAVFVRIECRSVGVGIGTCMVLVYQLLLHTTRALECGNSYRIPMDLCCLRMPRSNPDIGRDRRDSLETPTGDAECLRHRPVRRRLEVGLRRALRQE